MLAADFFFFFFLTKEIQKLQHSWVRFHESFGSVTRLISGCLSSSVFNMRRKGGMLCINDLYCE